MRKAFYKSIWMKSVAGLQALLLLLSVTTSALAVSDDGLVVYQGKNYSIKIAGKPVYDYLVFRTSDNRVFSFRDDSERAREGKYSGEFGEEIEVLYDDGIDYVMKAEDEKLSFQTGSGKKKKTFSYKLVSSGEDRDNYVDRLYQLLGDKESALSARSAYESAISEKYEIVKFGEWKPDVLGTTPTLPIEWIVLKNDDQKSLLLSKFILASQSPYNRRFQAPKAGDELKTYLRWGGSYIRLWLNNDFYQEAFSEEEKSAICSTKLHLTYPPNANNLMSVSDETTSDYVFLLSKEEVAKYLPDGLNYGGELIVPPSGNTDFAGWLTLSETERFDWYCVLSFGLFPNTPESRMGIRPAMWVSNEAIFK